MNPLDFVREKGWQYTVYGEEIKTGCPFTGCPNSGQPQFYINKTSGKWICHRCRKSGNTVKSLKYQLGEIQLLSPDSADHIIINYSDVMKYHAELLSKNNNAFDYLTTTRGLSLLAIKNFKLGYRVTDNEPSIVIPYFDRDGVCVGLKYNFYTLPAGKPKVRFEKDSKIQLFNLDKVSLEKPLIITEGEYDAITAWQSGYTNVCSVPSGAGNVNGWIEDIRRGKEFILCYDNDNAGREGAKKVSEALGVSKCKRAIPRLKDLNEYLQCGRNSIREVFENLRPMFQPPKTAIGNYVKEAINEITNPSKQSGCPSGWQDLDLHLGGWRTGEITIITGKTGHGKSTWGIVLQSELSKQADFNWKFLMITGEDRCSKIVNTLCANHYGRRPTPQDVERFAKEHGDKFHLVNVHDKWSSDNLQMDVQTLINVVEHYIDNMGVNFVFIDHAHLFIKEGEKEISEIQQFMQKLRHIVSTRKVHVMLVVQPTKIPVDQKQVRMSHLRGSVIWEQSCWNCISIYRSDEDSHEVTFLLEKNRENGMLGAWKLTFDVGTKAHYREY